MRQMFRKGQVLTIPNLMSFFRILLVPFIIWAILGLKNDILAIVLLAVSALTDVLDGQIARRFNMISELGKALDPVADKLTQVSMVLCLAFRYPLMWYLLGICVFRETCMFILGLIYVKKNDSTFSAKWYGKVSTALLYATGLALLVFSPILPDWLANGLILLCMVCVLTALILYIRFHIQSWKRLKTEAAG